MLICSYPCPRLWGRVLSHFHHHSLLSLHHESFPSPKNLYYPARSKCQILQYRASLFIFELLVANFLFCFLPWKCWCVLISCGIRGKWKTSKIILDRSMAVICSFSIPTSWWAAWTPLNPWEAERGKQREKRVEKLGKDYIHPLLP